MRDWSEFDLIYDELFKSIYPQPEDDGHTGLAEMAIKWAMTRPICVRSALDFGCGTGFCQPILKKYGVDDYLGVAWGKDVQEAWRLGRNAVAADYNFLQLDRQFDLGIARHSLEHSPFPILTLVHWRRFLSRWLLVVLPAPEWYRYNGQNHFNVMPEEQAENVFELAGYKIRRKHIEYHDGLPYMVSPLSRTKYEFWYLLKKV